MGVMSGIYKEKYLPFIIHGVVKSIQTRFGWVCFVRNAGLLGVGKASTKDEAEKQAWIEVGKPQ